MPGHVRRVGRRGTVGLVALGLALTSVAPAAASPTMATARAEDDDRQVVMTELPPIGDDTRGMATDINNRGQIVGLSGWPVRPVLWEGGEVVDLAPSVVSPQWDPRFINDRGQIGTVIDGHAAIWHRGRVTDIDGDAIGSSITALNERGQALVSRGYPYPGPSPSFALWDGDELIELTSPLGPTYGAFATALSDRGHVVMTSTNPGCIATGFCPNHVWYRGTYTELAPGGIVSERFHSSESVNRSGRVVGGVIRPGGGGSLAAVWDGRDGDIVSLLDCRGDFARAAVINDRGQVAGTCVVRATETEDRVLEAVVWDDGEVVTLPSPADRSVSPQVINERGQVLGGDHNPVLWDRGEVFDLSRWATVSAWGWTLNDRGQVVGENDGKPVVWELR